MKTYWTYKQTTVGDNNTVRSGGFDFKAATEYNAWEKLKGITKDEATEQYISIINRLKG